MSLALTLLARRGILMMTPVLPVVAVLVLLALPLSPGGDSGPGPADAVSGLVVLYCAIRLMRDRRRPLSPTAAVLLGLPVVGLALAATGRTPRSRGRRTGPVSADLRARPGGGPVADPRPGRLPPADLVVRGDRPLAGGRRGAPVRHPDRRLLPGRADPGGRHVRAAGRDGHGNSGRHRPGVRAGPRAGADVRTAAGRRRPVRADAAAAAGAVLQPGRVDRDGRDLHGATGAGRAAPRAHGGCGPGGRGRGPGGRPRCRHGDAAGADRQHQAGHRHPRPVRRRPLHDVGGRDRHVARTPADRCRTEGLPRIPGRVRLMRRCRRSATRRARGPGTGGSPCCRRTTCTCWC